MKRRTKVLLFLSLPCNQNDKGENKILQDRFVAYGCRHICRCCGVHYDTKGEATDAYAIYVPRIVCAGQYEHSCR